MCIVSELSFPNLMFTDTLEKLSSKQFLKIKAYLFVEKGKPLGNIKWKQVYLFFLRIIHF